MELLPAMSGRQQLAEFKKESMVLLDEELKQEGISIELVAAALISSGSSVSYTT